MIFAEASNASVGTWVYSAAAVIGLIIAVGSYFATRREVEELSRRLEKQDESSASAALQLEANLNRLDRSDEARISGIHHRLNPLETRAAKMEGQMEAFAMSFEKFTRIIESTSRARDDQTGAFIRALDTFASVLADKRKDT